MAQSKPYDPLGTINPIEGNNLKIIE
jgi:hypothetical protein